MNMLDVRDRIIAGIYRSDRFPAVPFQSLEDVLQEALDALKPRPGSDVYPTCGAALTTGNQTWYCAERLGHAFSGGEHDWAHRISR